MATPGSLAHSIHTPHTRHCTFIMAGNGHFDHLDQSIGCVWW